MAKILLSAINQAEVSKHQAKVEDHSKTIMDIVNSIIQPYCKDLDRYVDFIRDCLKDGDRQPTLSAC